MQARIKAEAPPPSKEDLMAEGYLVTDYNEHRDLKPQLFCKLTQFLQIARRFTSKEEYKDRMRLLFMDYNFEIYELENAEFFPIIYESALEKVNKRNQMMRGIERIVEVYDKELNNFFPSFKNLKGPDGEIQPPKTLGEIRREIQELETGVKPELKPIDIKDLKLPITVDKIHAPRFKSRSLLEELIRYRKPTNREISPEPLEKRPEEEEEDTNKPQEEEEEGEGEGTEGDKSDKEKKNDDKKQSPKSAKEAKDAKQPKELKEPKPNKEAKEVSKRDKEKEVKEPKEQPRGADMEEAKLRKEKEVAGKSKESLLTEYSVDPYTTDDYAKPSDIDTLEMSDYLEGDDIDRLVELQTRDINESLLKEFPVAQTSSEDEEDKSMNYSFDFEGIKAEAMMPESYSRGRKTHKKEEKEEEGKEGKEGKEKKEKKEKDETGLWGQLSTQMLPDFLKPEK
eukprot:TRINITY_DN12432_c0_g2_i1.p1 TRINITY_DN12432_c0_g2~~TRINITY_DN12432_c0_g2_i1.p1  ORF type:complete len:453 (-),score=165.00 TRINITY_DN12432_c0_g2_i1:800-2158(-)